MVRRKRGLGSRGLDALLSGQADSAEDDNEDGELRTLAVEHIQRGRYQPRMNIRSEELEELASSIRAQGLIQPVVVRKHGDGYELIAGERRWRAAQLAGLREIPALVRDLPDQAVAAMSLIENIQREDLNPIEESMALARLIEEFGLTHQQTADAIGRSRAAVTNLLRLRELGEVARQLLETGVIEMGHARALLALEAAEQARVAREIAAKGLSVRQAEQLIRTRAKAPVAPRKSSPDVARVETDIAERLGAKVRIEQGNKGSGRLIIQYNSLDELDGILSHIK
ncbi:ParB/RepB/Spo0J family partition protein [Acidihalobacter prosperus]|uniref:Probable chromosome-partitioning protein ParB n=1 Tax=Acidihalobacter prosperus TaxID=160660 RepID=A0A1A6C4U2_9GAMM|nr:ParB/RepB/Spo0J family partition protein [Acidihalobacter prosperus]OBS09565.1 Chromosome (plasmid) partitioning protein ParB [Acidihalobacter prosperus]